MKKNERTGVDAGALLRKRYRISDRAWIYSKLSVISYTTWTSGNFFLLIKFYPYLCLVSKEEAKEDKVWTFFQKLFTVLKFLLGTLLNFL